MTDKHTANLKEEVRKYLCEMEGGNFESPTVYSSAAEEVVEIFLKQNTALVEALKAEAEFRGQCRNFDPRIEDYKNWEVVNKKTEAALKAARE